MSTEHEGISTFCQETSRPVEAESHLRRDLEINEENLGAFHPEVGVKINNLGMSFFDTGRVEEALPLIRRMALIFLRFTAETGVINFLVRLAGDRRYSVSLGGCQIREAAPFSRCRQATAADD
jgi:hypothetical protein